MLRRVAVLWTVLVSLLVSCDGGSGAGPGDPTGAGGGGGAPGPATRHHTFRAIAGISMGGIGASFIGPRHPERFDAIASLGGPLDTVYILHSFEHAQLSGFCSLAELEAILAANPGNPEVLDDPAMLPCMHKPPAETSTVIPEWEQNFNDFIFTTQGGNFDRDSYLEIFLDLSLALGNPLTYNPDSPMLPPGVTREQAERGLEECIEPVVLQGLHNKEFNPDGSYPVVTFCDGEEPIYYCKATLRPMDWCVSQDPDAFCADEGGVESATKGRNKELFYEKKGEYDPCYQHRKTFITLLAVDLNRNGRRDYGEPILSNGQERYQDTGVDGCANELEDGAGGCVATAAESPFAGGLADPNQDDYEWRHNPAGTERDWLHQEEEAYEDFGLDGVDGTGDLGEADGAHTLSPGVQKFHDYSPRLNIRKWSQEDRERIAYYTDGGIRDVFNFGVQAALVHGELAGSFPEEAAVYENFTAFPGGQETEDGFDPFLVPMDEVPRLSLFLYGHADATQLELERGDGDHVGTPQQAVNRFYLFLGWLSARWNMLPDPPGDNSEFNSRAFSMKFYSEEMQADRDFAIVLPPGYDAPENAEVRYPVLFMGHGYGMQAAGPDGFFISNILFDLYQNEGKIRKMIMVYIDGNCCYVDRITGARVCTQYKDDGSENGRDPALKRECSTGSFYVDRSGYGGGDDTRYESGVLELMDWVDAHYRTLAPADL